MEGIKEHINSLAEKVCEDPIIRQLINQGELKSFLVNGMSGILNRATVTERSLYLADNSQDSANGFSPVRSIKVGTTPIATSIPRTRSGEFYPSLLTKYERTIPEDYDAILLNLLLNSKTFTAVKRTLEALKLPYRPDQLDTLINEIYEEAKIFYSRRLSPDWFFIHVDAKRIDLMNENKKLEQAVIFTVVGVSNECKKEILSKHL